MTTRTWVSGFIASLVIFVLALASVWAITNNHSSEATQSATVAVDPSATKPPREAVVTAGRKVAENLGFKQPKVDQEVNQQAADKVEAGDRVFSDQRLSTAEVTAAFMASGTPAAKAALAEAMAQTWATPEELADPNNWIAVQTGEAIVWKGNTFLLSGKMVETGRDRIDQPGSVMMIFIPPRQLLAGDVTSVFIIRGVCKNPQVLYPQPAPPTTPPGEGLCRSTGEPVPPNGLCPKDPTQDVLINPDVPDQVKGPGTTPIGVNPGPATKPTDSPTGCNGPCPKPGGTTPKPPAPPSGPGPVVLPPPTQAPVPATGAPVPTAPATGTPDDF